VDREGRASPFGGASKTGEPRVLPLVSDLAAIIERRWRARDYKTANRSDTTISTYVFHRAGTPIVDFRKRWAAAAPPLGSPGLLFTISDAPACEPERSGVSQAVAMQITGHKTSPSTSDTGSPTRRTGARRLERMQAAIKEEPKANVTSLRDAGLARCDLEHALPFR